MPLTGTRLVIPTRQGIAGEAGLGGFARRGARSRAVPAGRARVAQGGAGGCCARARRVRHPTAAGGARPPPPRRLSALAGPARPRPASPRFLVDPLPRPLLLDLSCHVIQTRTAPAAPEGEDDGIGRHSQEPQRHPRRGRMLFDDWADHWWRGSGTCPAAGVTRLRSRASCLRSRIAW
jgi:hypothetical protein